MDTGDRQLLIDAIDAWVASYHKIEGFSRWRDDFDAVRANENMVFPHAGWDAEYFCTSPEGERVLREIFGKRRDVAGPSPHPVVERLEQVRFQRLLLTEWQEALLEAAQHYDENAIVTIASDAVIVVRCQDDTPLWQVCIDGVGRMMVDGIDLEDASSGGVELVHVTVPGYPHRLEIWPG